MQLQLTACPASGRLTYGSEADRCLAALLAADWAPFLVLGSSESVQAELAAGALSPEAVEAAVAADGGVPVALCMPLRQLLALGSVAAGAALSSASGGEGGGDPLDDGPSPSEAEADVWVCGRLRRVLGKRLCTALDFGAVRPSQRPGSALVGSQRASLAVVQVPLPPDPAAARLGQAAAGRAAAPRVVEVAAWPCDQMWRLVPDSSAVVAGAPGAGGVGIGSSGGASGSGRPPQDAAGQLRLPEIESLVTWELSGYCSGAGVVATPAAACDPEAAPAGDGLRHKLPAGQQQQQQLPGLPLLPPAPQQPCATTGGGSSGSASSGGGLLLRISLLHVELAVLAHLSGEPELLAACRRSAATGGSAYEHVAAVWAAAAGGLQVAGSGDGDPYHSALIGAATAEAAVQALVHQWRCAGWGHG